jgi:hypothetical protein
MHVDRWPNKQSDRPSGMWYYIVLPNGLTEDHVVPSRRQGEKDCRASKVLALRGWAHRESAMKSPRHEDRVIRVEFTDMP